MIIDHWICSTAASKALDNSGDHWTRLKGHEVEGLSHGHQILDGAGYFFVARQKTNMSMEKPKHFKMYLLVTLKL